MNNKAKKIIGSIAVIATLGMLSACNSFCSDQDSSSYRYGYDSVNTSFFDTREDALTFANNFVPKGYTEFTLDTQILDRNGEKTSFISESTFKGYNLYYIHPCVIEIKTLEADSNGKYTTIDVTFSKSTFTREFETTAKEKNINLPYNAYYEELDRLTLNNIYKTAINENDSNYSTKGTMDLKFVDIYGYTFEDLMAYRNDRSNNELLQKMLKGSESNVGRNNSLLVKYGYSKYYNTLKPTEEYYNLDRWNDQINQEFGTNFGMNSDYLKLFKVSFDQKIATVKTCISIEDGGLYGHLSSDPLNETVPITNKAPGGFWEGWGNAFSKHGFLEGLLVYPIAYGVETMAHSFGMNGWGQILAVLIMTIIIRAFFMVITLPSTISQQKMTFLQPEIAKLQLKYPNSNTNQYEKQRFAQAQMALYKKHKVHPFLSILVMVVQFPLFIAVWNAMTGSASLSSDSVLGLYLSDTIWNTLTNLSGWPALPGWWTAVILILLMSVSQIISMMLPQWLNKRRMKNVKKTVNSQAQDSQQSQMKMMNWIMTAFVIVMGFTLPSAMGVYWFAGAVFSIIQTLVTQAIMNRKKKEK